MLNLDNYRAGTILFLMIVLKTTRLLSVLIACLTFLCFSTGEAKDQGTSSFTSGCKAESLLCKGGKLNFKFAKAKLLFFLDRYNAFFPGPELLDTNTKRVIPVVTLIAKDIFQTSGLSPPFNLC